MSRQHAKTIFVSFLIMVGVLTGSCSQEGKPKRMAGGVDWLISMEEALAEAERQDRPIMIDVYADWCGWCETLDEETYVDENVIAKAQEFVNLKIDADVHRSIMSDYRIAGLPTILFIDANGKEIHRIVGYKPPEDFVRDMDTALDAFRSGKGS